MLSRREEAKQAEEVKRLLQEENAKLRRKMLAMESARLEQDKKMGLVLEGIMVRLGAGPLPEAVVVTPPRGVTGSNMTQQWLPAGEVPPYSKEPPATNNRPVARQLG